MKVWQHFCTISKHKILVMKGCFELGLIRQGLLHDLTKYSPSEFWVGCKYYQGDKSPNDAERMDKGYSSAWLHHKGRNKHHLEYWLDYGVPDKEGPNKGKRKGICGMKMPIEYVVEMYVDRVAASKNYQKDKYRDDSALVYYQGGKAGTLLHEDTKALLELLLHMLAKRGEAQTKRFIRTKLLKGRVPYEKTALNRLQARL